MGKNHDILGIEPRASNKEIKDAFKKLAKELHPDTHPGDEVAAERFKHITRAYNELLDGISGDDPQEAAMEYAKQFFEDDFNPFDPIHREERIVEVKQDFDLDLDGPATVHVRIQVPISKLINGGQIVFQYNKPRFTPAGFLYENYKKRVTLPPNTPVGKILIFEGEGSCGLGGGTEAGDLLVSLYPKSEKQYEVDDIDLSAKHQIDAFEAILGTKYEFDLPTGKRIRLDIPAGIQSGKVLRLSECGMTHINGDVGDLFIQIFITTPILTSAQRTIISEVVKKFQINE